MVKQYLSVAPARRDDTPIGVPYGDDRSEVPRSRSTSSTKRHQLGARSAGEVEDVDSSVHGARGVANGCTDRVKEPVTGSFGHLSCERNELEVCRIGFAGVAVHQTDRTTSVQADGCLSTRRPSIGTCRVCRSTMLLSSAPESRPRLQGAPLYRRCVSAPRPGAGSSLFPPRLTLPTRRSCPKRDHAGRDEEAAAAQVSRP